MNMMRCRAWDTRPELERMYFLKTYVCRGLGWEGGDPNDRFYELILVDGFKVMHVDEVILMRSSGILSKAGQEIYEDDICADSAFRFIVKFGLYEHDGVEHYGWYMQYVDREGTGPLTPADGSVISVLGDAYRTGQLLIKQEA